MSSPTPLLTPGRIILTLLSLSTSISCYIADWNETHVKNPRWPPHARFHNGQTMSMGLCLGLLMAYFTWRGYVSNTVATQGRKGAKGMLGVNAEKERDSLWTAALIGSLYWVTGLSAILYPGAKWVDPDLGDGAPQMVVFLGHLGLTWVGYWLEMRRLKR